MQVLLAKISVSDIVSIFIVAIVVVILIVVWWARQRRSRQKTSAVYYVEALKELIRGDQDSALANLKMVVTQDTGNIDAYLKLGDILRQKGERNKALQLHRQLTVRNDLSSSDRKELLKSLTLDYLESGKEERAVATLQELLSLDKKNLWGLEQLLQLYQKQGQWIQALAIQEAIFKNTGQEDDALLALYEVQMGDQLAAHKQYHKARLKYKDAIRRDRQCVPAYLGLGDAYQQEDRLDEAIESWKDLMDRVPQKAYLVFRRLEKALFDQGKFGEVAKIYRELLGRDLNNTKALLALANIHEKKGDIDAAIKTCQQALQIDNTFLDAKRFLVHLYGQKGYQKEMLDTLKDLVHQSSQDYFCTNCGYRSRQPLWRCPQCAQWRSFDL